MERFRQYTVDISTWMTLVVNILRAAYYMPGHLTLRQIRRIDDISAITILNWFSGKSLNAHARG